MKDGVLKMVSRPMGCPLCLREPCRCDELTRDEWEKVAEMQFQATINDVFLDLRRAGLEAANTGIKVRDAINILLAERGAESITTENILEKVKEMGG